MLNEKARVVRALGRADPSGFIKTVAVLIRAAIFSWG
jgi:hypothetical protein